MLFAFLRLLSFSRELRHFVEKCSHNSKRLHDIKTIKLFIVPRCSSITAEETPGGWLCFPGLVKIQYCFHLFIFWIPVNLEYMLLLSFSKLNLQVEKLNTTKNIYILVTALLAVRATDTYLVSIYGLWAQKTNF